MRPRNSGTTLERLLGDLDRIQQKLEDLIKFAPVLRFDESVAGLIIIRPKYYFGELSSNQKHEQLQIKRQYERWIERVAILCTGAPKTLRSSLNKADREFRNWLELSSNWSIKPDTESNMVEVHRAAEQLRDILRVFGMAGGNPIVIPDTNALLHAPDPVDYRRLVSAQSFTFLLLPTVLHELDELKILHRNPDIRDRATQIITRIKGWRNQGVLVDGVTVDKTITVKAVAEEPSVKSTLSWLDPDNRDDRIIASTITVQTAYPTIRIVLVTGDINLQNKADAASIEALDLPTVNNTS